MTVSDCASLSGSSSPRPENTETRSPSSGIFFFSKMLQPLNAKASMTAVTTMRGLIYLVSAGLVSVGLVSVGLVWGIGAG